MELKRDKLLNGDMVQCMVELQNFEDIDVEGLISAALQIKNKFDDQIGKMFEMPK